VGAAALFLLIASVAVRLLPDRVRSLRFELRYPLAGAAAAVIAAGLHEIVGFGVQTPVNRYLLAVWLGLVWGVWNRVEAGRSRSAATAAARAIDGEAARPQAEGESPIDSGEGGRHEY